MANGFEQTYTIVGDLPPGDALKAQRAVTAEGAEVVVKTVRPVAPDMFVRAIARVAGVAGPHNESVLAWEEQGQFVKLATAPVGGADLGRELEKIGEGTHERGIVHGSVKPSTLIQTPVGNVVVVDAGLAQAQGGADLTEQAAPLNAAYVSPEEALGRPLAPAWARSARAGVRTAAGRGPWRTLPWRPGRSAGGARFRRSRSF